MTDRHKIEDAIFVTALDRFVHEITQIVTFILLPAMEIKDLYQIYPEALGAESDTNDQKVTTSVSQSPY